MIPATLRKIRTYVASSLLPAPAPVVAQDGPPSRATLARFLGLSPAPEYAAGRMAMRAQILERISDCSPANTTPQAMVPYTSESALRFHDTLEWVATSLRELAPEKPRLLEIGSNPYFLTLLLAERFPHLEHIGVNYYGAPTPGFELEPINDPRGRLKASRFLHANIERHSLELAGSVDVALFCEVLEHLPFDPAWAFWNIARRIRPGGHLILTTPNPARFENLLRLAERRETISDPISISGLHGRHNREYSANELADLAQGTGMRVLQAKTIDVFPGEYSRDGEARGYGAYHMLRAELTGEAKLYRPPWLYAGFSADALASPESLSR